MHRRTQAGPPGTSDRPQRPGGRDGTLGSPAEPATIAVVAPIVAIAPIAPIRPVGIDESRTHPGRRRALRCAILAVAGALTVGFMPRPAAALEVSGFQFSDAISLAGRQLVLNGVGLRSIFIMKVFLGALYVPERSRDPATLMAQTGPRRLAMRMLIDMSPERLLRSLESNERRAAPVAGLETALMTVGLVPKGAGLDIDLIDGVVHFAVNGQARGSIRDGDQVFAAMLRAWLGERPIERDLKLGLLGLAQVGN